MAVNICGTGSYIPSHVMDNDGIAGLVDTSDQWIRERTGVKRRHIVDGETTVSMACEAGLQALRQADVAAEEIDLILVSTISSNVILPCAACEVQKRLRAVNATCFDLSAACTGFVLAYNTAAAYLAGGIYKTALVIGSESLSNLTNWKDRGTCILFGDGAGAAVLKADARRMYFPVTHSDGGKGGALTLKSRHDWNVLNAPVQGDERYNGDEFFMQMDGKAVFQFAVKKVPEVIRETLERNGVSQEEISWFLLHQANKRIVESVAKRLGEPIEKFPMNIQEYGNTSSASIPILLDEMNRRGALKKGQKLVMAGFGAGLTWGAALYEWI
ncbi:MAG: ketoacyl-ACP synthase III [Lachnospiraceae bacterium]|nr:ketoacyl-ACP synthase III [Lachnospiraceae bacterium]